MKVQQLIKETCAIVSEDIGTAKADQIAQAAQKRYEALCAENASDSKELRAHSYKRIYPGIAVYEALRAEGFLKRKPSGISANTSSVLPPREFLCSNGPSKRLVLRASFLVFLNQVSRKAAHQARGLSLNIQKVMATKLGSIL